jgi:hypothetical protein
MFVFPELCYENSNVLNPKDKLTYHRIKISIFAKNNS